MCKWRASERVDEWSCCISRPLGPTDAQLWAVVERGVQTKGLLSLLRRQPVFATGMPTYLGVAHVMFAASPLFCPCVSSRGCL
jgi:hypothetical protein